MDFVKLFESFWQDRGQYNGYSNPTRTYENISRALASCKTVSDIDDYIFNLSSRKETNRQIMVAFFDYLKEKRGMEIDSVLYDKRFYDLPLERQLEIAKYLHEPRELWEIEDHFDITDETRKKDIRALEDGVEFLGAEISIKKDRVNGMDHYRSTMHPIFLPLNLTEVYAMTAYLEKKLDPSDVNTKIIRDIIARIKSQLSDYALRKLKLERDDAIDNNYIDDEHLARQRKGIRMYLMKSGQPCRFFWKGSEYIGRLKIQRGKEFIQLEDGSELEADPKDVEFMIESLDYR